jgi:hypothetical protein
MFGWFRKKKDVRPTSEADELLALSDTAFADLCTRIIEDEASEANAMVVVAYANMQSIYPSCIYAIERDERRETHAPPPEPAISAKAKTRLADMTPEDIVKAIDEGDKEVRAAAVEVLAHSLTFESMAHRYDDAFRFIFAKLTSPTDDEINKRRYEWFLRALLLYRLMQKAPANPSLKGTIVRIWATLASSGQYLKTLLEGNIIWSEEEKSWFANLKDANDGVSYVVNIMLPECYRSDPVFQELARKHQFYKTAF